MSVAIVAPAPAPVAPAARRLRVAVHAATPERRRALAARVEAAGHLVADHDPDVLLAETTTPPGPAALAEAPLLALSDTPGRWGEMAPLGVLPRAANAAQLDAGLRAVAAGLVVRGRAPRDGRGAAPEFQPAADDPPLLTPREVEILTLIGEGLSNKAVARRLSISAHTVKFHLEAVFDKLNAASRAEAVAKGLRGGVIQL